MNLLLLIEVIDTSFLEERFVLPIDYTKKQSFIAMIYISTQQLTLNIAFLLQIG